MGLFRRGAQLAHAGKDESVDDDPAHADIKEGLQMPGACYYPAFGAEEQVSEGRKEADREESCDQARGRPGPAAPAEEEDIDSDGKKLGGESHGQEEEGGDRVEEALLVLAHKRDGGRCNGGEYDNEAPDPGPLPPGGVPPQRLVKVAGGDGTQGMQVGVGG